MALPCNFNLFGLSMKRPYYCEVEYLESSGTQYIDTLEKDTTGYVYKASIKPTSDGAWILWFGRQDTNTGGQCEFVGYNGDNKLGASILTAGVGNTIGAQTAATNVLYNIETSSVAGNIYFSVNGTKTTASRTGDKCSRNIYIFCINNAGTANNFVSMCLYKFQMYNSSGKLVRDFMPVLDWNMRPALYDKISNKLFYNSGSGEFTVGRQIHYVEYLESTGTQYIDTGYCPTVNTEYEERVMFTGNPASTSASFVRWSYAPSYDSFGQYFNGTSSCVIYFGRYSDNKFTTITGFDASKELTIKNMKTFVSIGNSKLDVTRENVGWDNSYPLYLFAGLNVANVVFKANMKFYYHKTWEDGVLVRYYLPAVDENGVGFLFDKVSHTIYDNNGSGDFKYPDVELEYLETDGNSYIDTDIIFAGDDVFKIVGLRTGTAGRSLFGGRTANNVYNGLYEYNRAIYACVNNTYTKVDAVWTLDEEHDMSYTDDTLTIDGTDYTLRTVVNTVNYMSFFGLNNGGAITAMASDGSYIKSSQYIHNNTLTKDYVPVLHEGSFCLYDKVSHTYTTNGGTGTFKGKIKEKR